MRKVRTYTLTEALSKLNESDSLSYEERKQLEYDARHGDEYAMNRLSDIMDNDYDIPEQDIVPVPFEQHVYNELLQWKIYWSPEELNRKIVNVFDENERYEVQDYRIIRDGNTITFKWVVDEPSLSKDVLNVHFEDTDTILDLIEKVRKLTKGMHESIKRKSSKKLNESAYEDKLRIYIPEVKKIGSDRFQYEVPYREYEMSTGDFVGEGTEDFSLRRAMTGIRVYAFNAQDDEGIEYNIGVCVNSSVDEGQIEDAIKNIYDMDYVRMKSSDNFVHPMAINDMEWDL